MNKSDWPAMIFLSICVVCVTAIIITAMVH